MTTKAIVMQALKSNNFNSRAIANETGYSIRTIQRIAKDCKTELTTIQEVVDVTALRRYAFKKKASKDFSITKQIEVPLKPLGILHLGDLHLDDDGVDLDMLNNHLEIAKANGLLLGNLGDSLNNWVGGLAKLYGKQTTTVEQALKMLKDFLRNNKFLYTIVGNHDKWNEGRYLLEEYLDGNGFVGEDIRLELVFPNDNSVTIHARHSFAGQSSFNTAHGALRHALFNRKSDLIIQGHLHSTGYGLVKDVETGATCHCVAVGTYKMFDDYRESQGFRDNNISPCVVTIINPYLAYAHPDKLKIFYDPSEGVDYLNYLRTKYDT